MRKIQCGDCVRVHYRKLYEDGVVFSSHGKPPLVVVVGTPHPRLPGLNNELVGLATGDRVAVDVPARTHNQVDLARRSRIARSRFPDGQAIVAGQWRFALDGRGRKRCVRILESYGDTVVVDASATRCRQSMTLELRVVNIETETG